ncbi:MAG: tetratricopeptide repeat protein, partial [Calditrichia bacterium]|nr:tetratricopeptide repeat protein [Calditrichia bacterium]
GIAQSSNYLGILSRFFGIYDSALEKHYNALQIYQNMKNENGIASTINYIGLVYRNLGNADKALNYYQQALKTIKRTKNYLTKSDILNNLGSLYWYAGDNDKALNYYHQALEIRKQFPEKADRIAGSLNNIGNVYRKMNKVSEAVKYYNESIKISEPIGDKNLISVTLKNLGISYLNLSRFMKAEEYFKKSLIISREINLKRIIEENLSNLARLYKLQKKYKLAQETQILYFEIKDSILNEKVHRVIADLQVKYETERKKKEIQFLEFEKQKNLRNLLVVISILVLLLTLVVFSMYRIKSRTNKLLRMKNQEISEKHKALNSLNLKLEESEYTYRYLFENNALPMLIYYSNSLEIAAVNNTAVELYGYSIDEFKKLHFSDIYLEWDFKNEPSLIKNI